MGPPATIAAREIRALFAERLGDDVNEVTSAKVSAWDSSIKQEVVNRVEEMKTSFDSFQQDILNASGQGVRTNH